MNRSRSLFEADIELNLNEIRSIVKASRFLVVGGAGSIGRQLVKELFSYDPMVLHVIDLSENGLVELVRQIRSTSGYGAGDFRALPLDVGSSFFDAFIKSSGGYDFILNLSALKHVRSEKDPYTLMRLIEVNIFNAVKLAMMAKKFNAKYFVVSTDKAANPVNLMGASKRIMEKFMLSGEFSEVSMARFANVAFSDGSLLQSFQNRLQERQPIVAPNDVERYFLTPKESGWLCLLSALFGRDGEIFVPKMSDEIKLTKFSDIAERYIKEMGLSLHYCHSEEEARKYLTHNWGDKKWPVYFFESDTTGEKLYEEFYTSNEHVEFKRFKDIGVIIQNKLPLHEINMLKKFEEQIHEIMMRDVPWKKEEIVTIFLHAIPELTYEDRGRYLDEKM